MTQFMVSRLQSMNIVVEGSKGTKSLSSCLTRKGQHGKGQGADILPKHPSITHQPHPRASSINPPSRPPNPNKLMLHPNFYSTPGKDRRKLSRGKTQDWGEAKGIAFLEVYSEGTRPSGARRCSLGLTGLDDSNSFG